jgi:hypothetical protein
MPEEILLARWQKLKKNKAEPQGSEMGEISRTEEDSFNETNRNILFSAG